MARVEEYGPAVAMVAVQAIYASVVLLLKLCFNKGMSLMVFLLYRHIVASLSLAPLAYVIHRRSQQVVSVGKKAFFLVFLAALIGVTINQSLYLTGLNLGSSSLATAMSNLAPAVTFLMTASIGMEKVDMRSVRSLAKVVGTAICVGGAVSMALFKGEKLLLPLHASVGKNWLLACFSLLGNNICLSLWLILQVPLCHVFRDPIVLSFWMCVFASIQYLAAALFLERDPSAWRFGSNLEIFSCIYAGIVGSATVFWLLAWCVSKRGPLFSALFNPLCVVITTMFAFVVTHEHLYLGSMVGAVAVVVGLYVVLWGKAAEEPIGGGGSPGGVDERTDADLEEPLVSSKNVGVFKLKFAKDPCPSPV